MRYRVPVPVPTLERIAVLGEERPLPAMEQLLALRELRSASGSAVDEGGGYSDEEWERLYDGLLSSIEGRYDRNITERNLPQALTDHRSLARLGHPAEQSAEELDYLYFEYLRDNGFDAAATETARRITGTGASGGRAETLESYLAAIGNGLRDAPFEQLVDGCVTVLVSLGIKMEDGIGRPSYSVGSGFFIDSGGHILTNYHVVSSEVDPAYNGFSELFVILSGESGRIPARVVGWDEELDIALLKTAYEPAQILPLSSRTDYGIGEPVYAIGSPGGLDSTLTTGVISAIRDDLMTLGSIIQLDAPINPGNSGGPLLNEEREVIGVVVAGAEGFEGVNFAIPVQVVARYLDRLYQGGALPKSWLGTVLHESEGDPPEILYTVPHSPADRTGLRSGDRIRSVNGFAAGSVRALQDYLSTRRTGELIAVEIYRPSEERLVSVTVSLSERPLLPMLRASRNDSFTGLFLPLLGMEAEPIESLDEFRVTRVIEGGAAEHNGILENDVFHLYAWRIDTEANGFFMSVKLIGNRAGYFAQHLTIGAPLALANVL